MNYRYEGLATDHIEIPNNPAISAVISPVTRWPLGLNPTDLSPEAFLQFKEQARLLLHNQALELKAARAEIVSLRDQLESHHCDYSPRL